MGTNYYAVSAKPSLMEPLHIGKQSYGWKFCFHVVDKYNNPLANCSIDNYETWYSLLKKNTENGKIVIMNEYSEIVPFEDFIKGVQVHQEINNPHDFEYADNVCGYRFMEGEFS